MSTLYHNNGDFKITEGLNHQKYSYFTIRVENFDYSAWIEHDLPTPTIINHTKYGYTLTWALNGFFWTGKGKNYLNDTINKILSLIPDSSIYENVPFVTKYSLVCEMIYHLHDFQHIPDRRVKVKRDFKKHNEKSMAKDEIFEIARFQCYDLKLQGRLTYEACYDIFYTVNLKYKLGKKDDIKYKAKSVYAWTRDNYNPEFLTLEAKHERKRIAQNKYYKKKNNIETKGEDKLMTREENARLQAIQKEEDNYNKVLECIRQMSFLQIKINAVNISKEIDMTRQTASKYLKMIKAEEQKKKEKDNKYISPFFKLK